MKIVFNTLAFLMFLLFVSSCKKDKDTVSPVITISLPTENSNYNVFDTIRVKATINDDVQLNSVTLKLLNASLVPVQNSLVIKPESRSYTLDQFYFLYDVHLTSGIYYISVVAGDGTNTTIAYRKISINEEPLKRTGFILFNKPSFNTLNISKIDSSFNTHPILGNLTSDYSGSAISSYYQMVYVAGKHSGSFKAIELENNTVKWSISPIVSSAPYFTGISSNASNVFISYYEGFTKEFDRFGAIRSQSSVGVDGFYPQLFFDSGENFIMEQIDATSTTKKIVVYNSSTGTGVKEIISNIDVITFCKKDVDNIFVFGNDNMGQGVMKIYQVQANNLWMPHVLPAGKIYSATQVDANTYIIGHTNGNIYSYTYSTNSLITILSGVTANNLKYDSVKNQLIVTGSYDVKIYDYTFSLGTLVKTIISVDSVYNVEVLYNK